MLDATDAMHSQARGGDILSIYREGGGWPGQKDGCVAEAAGSLYSGAQLSGYSECCHDHLASYNRERRGRLPSTFGSVAYEHDLLQEPLVCETGP